MLEPQQPNVHDFLHLQRAWIGRYPQGGDVPQASDEPSRKRPFPRMNWRADGLPLAPVLRLP